MGFRASLGLALLLLVAAPASARKGAPDGARPADAEQAAVAGAAEATPESAAEIHPGIDPSQLNLSALESDRAIRIRNAIQADRRKLADLRQELVTVERSYEELTRDRERLGEALEGAEAALTARSAEADPTGRAEAERDVEMRRVQYDLIKRRASIAFQAMKRYREQIRKLEDKIALDTEGLDRMLGLARAPEPAAVPPAPTGAAQAPAAAPLIPLPGAGALRGPDAPSGAATPAFPESAEQIEARKVAEKRERQALRAERALADFVDRKAALEEQIALERGLLATTKEAEENLEQGLAALQDRMTEMVAAGASQAELGRVQQAIQTDSDELEQVRTLVDTRTEEIDRLQDRLMAAQRDQLAVIEEAERRRADAEKARQRSIWLDSPLHPENVQRWGRARGPRVFLALLAAGSLLLVVRFFTTRLTKLVVRAGRLRRGGGKRADTLASSFRSASTAVIVVGGLLAVLEQAGASVTTVLGGAAIFGVAVAFGAQNLMRDYFNGLVILIEDQYELGDLLTIGATTGRVERLNLRTTMLRDLQGRVHFIPNGEIKSVTNHTYEWARAVFDIGIAYKEDVDLVMRTLLELAEELRGDPDFKEAITEEPAMLGVDRFAEAGPVIKFMLKTSPEEMFRVKREMLRRIKVRFDQLGIAIPVPYRMVFDGRMPPTPEEIAQGVSQA